LTLHRNVPVYILNNISTIAINLRRVNRAKLPDGRKALRDAGMNVYGLVSAQMSHEKRLDESREKRIA
jgi:hypothetical protein